MRIVRGSEVQDFMRCRYRWAERWINNLQPLKPEGKLLAGTLIHKWLEYYYRDGLTAAYEAMGKLFAETDITRMDQAELDDLWGMCRAVVQNYYEFWKDVDANHTTLATELHFLIKLDDNISFEGTIDRVYQDQDGNIWFEDHKTTASIESYEKNSIMDRQISRYWFALQMLAQGKGYVELNEKYIPVTESLFYQKIKGKDIYGFTYNLLLKETPKEPKRLVKGGLSKDKSQKTTYELYVKALQELELAYEDGLPIDTSYLDILNHLKQQGNRYFKRVSVTRLQPEIIAAIREFHATACDLRDVEKAIVDHSAGELAYRNITKDCHWDCSFKALCVAGIEGSNVDLIRNTLYTTTGIQIEEETDHV